MEELEPIRSSRTLELELPPSCAQFCRIHPEYLVVGTYSLQSDSLGEEAARKEEEEEEEAEAKPPQSRNGSLLIFRIQGEDM